MKLLTEGNAKTKRGESLGVLTGIQHFDPDADPRVCPYASKWCKALCLVKSGRAEFTPMISVARKRKTLNFFENKQAYVEALKKDFKALIRRAKRLGLRPAVRLNGTSDILWERLINFADFPEIQFYDYTKIPTRLRSQASNYHLTFSFSGDNWDACLEELAKGVNVAVIFDGGIPTSFRGFKVIDGTIHDVRFLDGYKGQIIGLIPKGKRAKLAAKQGTPFIIKTASLNVWEQLQRKSA